MNKRKIYLIVLAIITIAGIIGGTVYHYHKFNNYINETFDYSTTPTGEYKDTQEFAYFDSIKVDGYIMTVDVISGTNHHAEVLYNNISLEPIITLENDTLRIRQSGKPKKMGKDNICHVIISVPENEMLSSIDIESNIGEIKIDNVMSEEIKVETNIGEIDIDSCEANYIKAQSNIGEIDVSVMGDIYDYNIDLSTNVGESKVNGQSVKRSYSQKGNTDKKIRLDTNIGEITLN